MDEMVIRFIESVELEIVESYDEEEKADTYCETFDVGSELEVDLLEDHGDSVDVQFGDGSCCFGIPKDIYEVVE